MNKKLTIRELREDRFISSNYNLKGEISEKFEMKDNDENNTNSHLLETPKKIKIVKSEIKTSPCQAKITMNTYLNLLKNQIFEKEEKPKETQIPKFLGKKRIKNLDNRQKSNLAEQIKYVSANINDISKNLNVKKINFDKTGINFSEKNLCKKPNLDTYNKDGKIFFEGNYKYTVDKKKGFHKIISPYKSDDLTKCQFDQNKNSDLFGNKYQIKNNSFINNENIENVHPNNNNKDKFDLILSIPYENTFKDNFYFLYNEYDKKNSNLIEYNISHSDSKRFFHQSNSNILIPLEETKNLLLTNNSILNSNGENNISNIYKKLKNSNDVNNINNNLHLTTFNSIFQKLHTKSKFLFSHSNILKSGYKFSDLINIDNIPSLNCESKTFISKLRKKIPQIPFKILDAPGLEDDFYQNLLEWSPKNLLAIGINDKIYIWDIIKNFGTSTINLAENEFSKLNIIENFNCIINQVSHIENEANETEINSVSAINWINGGEDLVIGLKTGTVLIYDINSSKLKNAYFTHSKRIGMFSAFPSNNSIFSCGSHDCKISHFDIRMKVPIRTLKYHKEELCGLKWSNDGFMLASGGNDNKLVFWNAFEEKPIQAFNNAHNSAVRALAWSQRKFGILASGGGAYDKKIKIWDSKTLKIKNEAETNSQVCNIIFSKNSNQFVSSHGFKDNVIYVWNENEMDIVTGLKGHKQRVIYLTQSPDGECIASGAGDETIRFWRVFGFDKYENDDEVDKDFIYGKKNYTEERFTNFDMINKGKGIRSKSSSKIGYGNRNKDENNLLKLDKIR